MKRLMALLMGLCLSGKASELASSNRPVFYQGMSDASAAVVVNSNLFLVADDEDNHLRLYRRDQPGPAIKEFDLTSFLEMKGRFLEADIEGAARTGHRAFWIGSHGRNRVGKERYNRCRLFATDLVGEGEALSLSPVGRPYLNLLDDLISDPRLAPFRLGKAAKRAPKEPGALNIEGLATTPGGGLLIGFRNPIPSGKALLVPLLNPDEVLAGKSARLGGPVQLDLAGLGIRDLNYYEGTYVVLAGPFHQGSPFRLYRWEEGAVQATIISSLDFGDAHPEAILIYPDTGLRQIQLLSDDGTQLVNGSPEKRIGESQNRSFRSYVVSP